MRLIEPDVKLEDQYLEMLDDWKRAGEKMVPFPLRFDPGNFQEMVKRLYNYKTHPDEGFVCHSTFWLIDKEKNIVGVSNVRHALNDGLRKHGGHIGYGISPSFRRQGYANSILELSLIEAKQLGIKKALLTCDKINIASAKTILNYGGVLSEELSLDGVQIQNYWIEIR